MLLQSVRWTLVASSAAVCVWLIVSLGHNGLHSNDWSQMILFTVLILAVSTPFALIAYFGITNQFRNLVTVVIALISFILFFLLVTVLSKVRFTDLIIDKLQPPILEALVGVGLSTLQMITPFVLTAYTYQALKRYADMCILVFNKKIKT